VHSEIVSASTTPAEFAARRPVGIIFSGGPKSVRVEGAPLEDGTEPQPLVSRSPEIVQGLRNLVQNAVDFARSTVWIDLDWTPAEVRVAIGDGLRYEAEQQAVCLQSEDMREAISAFAEGRTPKYHGR